MELLVDGINRRLILKDVIQDLPDLIGRIGEGNNVFLLDSPECKDAWAILADSRRTI